MLTSVCPSFIGNIIPPTKHGKNDSIVTHGSRLLDIKFELVFIHFGMQLIVHAAPCKRAQEPNVPSKDSFPVSFSVMRSLLPILDFVDARIVVGVEPQIQRTSPPSTTYFTFLFIGITNPPEQSDVSLVYGYSRILGDA
jgi:hypothetical protein